MFGQFSSGNDGANRALPVSLIAPLAMQKRKLKKLDFSVSSKAFFEGLFSYTLIRPLTKCRGESRVVAMSNLRVQPVGATPLVVYRLVFRSPKSFADVD